jgi:hypothetical protein
VLRFAPTIAVGGDTNLPEIAKRQFGLTTDLSSA